MTRPTLTHEDTPMTTLVQTHAVGTDAPTESATTRRSDHFRTVLAVHRGQVYVPKADLRDEGWLVRATADVPAVAAPAQRLAA